MTPAIPLAVVALLALVVATAGALIFLTAAAIAEHGDEAKAASRASIGFLIWVFSAPVCAAAIAAVAIIQILEGDAA